MDPDWLGVLMIAVGVGAWVLERYVPPPEKPPAGQGLEGIVDKTIDAAKTLPFPTLLVVLGFFLVLLDNGWLTIAAGG